MFTSDARVKDFNLFKGLKGSFDKSDSFHSLQ